MFFDTFGGRHPQPGSGKPSDPNGQGASNPGTPFSKWHFLINFFFQFIFLSVLFHLVHLYHPCRLFYHVCRSVLHHLYHPFRHADPLDPEFHLFPTVFTDCEWINESRFYYGLVRLDVSYVVNEFQLR